MSKLYDIKQTTDIPQIMAIISRPDAYQNIIYDGCPSVEEYVPNVRDDVWFILYYDGIEAGFIKLEYLNFALWMPHIYIIPEYRGSESATWGKQVANYMTERLGQIRFLALTPCKAAKEYAERVGFKLISVLKNSIKINGKSLDQYMLEK